MIFFVFATASCNLSCTYCGSTPEELCMPDKPSYETSKVLNFVRNDPSPTIVFYGGEPIMNLPFVMKVMDSLPQAKFVLQTNATLLYKLPTDYLVRFSAILVSIDGRRETVESYRGPGVYDKVIRNICDARSRGYTGHVVARMACSMNTDIYEDVTFLLNHEEHTGDGSAPFRFDAVYWQLDVEWDSPIDIRWGNFRKWRDHKYMPSVDRLFYEWLDNLRKGIVKVVVPFNTIVESVLDLKTLNGVPEEERVAQRSGYLRCSAGHSALSITTDGRVLACPVASTEEWNVVGSLGEKPASMVNKVVIGGSCLTCEVQDICGGRCLYSNKTLWWGEEGHDLVCDLNKQIINLCKDHSAEIQKLFEDGVIHWKDFYFPSEAYSLEIIP